MNQILIKDVLPFVLEKWKKTKISNRNPHPNCIIIALLNNGDIISVIPDLAYCLSKTNNNIKKIFKAVSLMDDQWIDIGTNQYCCGFTQLTDLDIPSNWKQNIKVSRGRSFLFRSQFKVEETCT